MNFSRTACRFFVVAVSLIVLVNCAGNRRFSELPTEVPDYTREVYQVGVGDSLSVLVWRNPELSIEVAVRPDGKISVPLVGDIFAAGKSAPDLSVEIEEILSNFVRTPKVTVIVSNANSTEFLNRVRITGALAAPQSIAFRKGMTVLDLVLLAGGLTEFADGNRAKLYRLTTEGIETHNLYLTDILKRGDVRSNYTLSPSDIITVPEKVL